MSFEITEIIWVVTLHQPGLRNEATVRFNPFHSMVYSRILFIMTGMFSVSAADYPTICELCNKHFSSPINAKEHFEGNGHKRRQSEHFAGIYPNQLIIYLTVLL